MTSRRGGPAARAQVIVLAGPSGAGKSRLAERTGLPVLRLDDFYKEATDPSLPRVAGGTRQARHLVDWDHPASWLSADAVATIEKLCRDGCASVPVYDIAMSGRRGEQWVDLDGHDLFVAEGIFAQDVVTACRDRGLLAAAFCVRQHPGVTFWRRLTRDLREHRKPPLVLLRRGIALLRAQRAIVQDAVDKGCAPVTPEEAQLLVRELAGH